MRLDPRVPKRGNYLLRVRKPLERKEIELFSFSERKVSSILLLSFLASIDHVRRVVFHRFHLSPGVQNTHAS